MTKNNIQIVTHCQYDIIAKVYGLFLSLCVIFFVNSNEPIYSLLLFLSQRPQYSTIRTYNVWYNNSTHIFSLRTVRKMNELFGTLGYWIVKQLHVRLFMCVNLYLVWYFLLLLLLLFITVKCSHTRRLAFVSSLHRGSLVF